MCELFGISAAQPVRAEELLREFFSHSVRHPNGWGLATFPYGEVSIEKEPVQASKSAYLKERLCGRVDTSTLLAHIRLATMGSMEYGNCHPFLRQDNRGRRWVLIHNGTIFDYPPLAPYQYRQAGGTDSERVLLYLVGQIDRRQSELGRALEPEERCVLLDGLVSAMAPGNKLNLLLYDGELMYAHTNYANSLYVKRMEGAALFATVPLDHGDWQPMPFTALCAYQAGEQVYQGQPHGAEYFVKEEDMRYLFAAYSSL